MGENLVSDKAYNTILRAEELLSLFKVAVTRIQQNAVEQCYAKFNKAFKRH